MIITNELVTQIIVFLTAIIGLYRVAGAKEDDPFGERVREVLAVVLVPATMLALLWLFTSLPHLLGTMLGNDIPIDPEAQNAEQMIAITKSFWDQSMRQDALHMTIERALADRRYDIAVRAADDLNPTGQADVVRMRAIRLLSGTKPN